MNEIINKFLLAGHKFLPKCILDSPDLPIVLVNHLRKTKKEYKNLKNLEIQDIFIKMN